jgi:quinol monooxygenase YgiN
MIIRIFDTAVDPEDVDRAKELFRGTVRSAFERFDGCHGIEMYVGVEEHSGDLIDVVAISRWDSPDAIQRAIEGDDYDQALAELRKLFEQAPIIRHFELVD